MKANVFISRTLSQFNVRSTTTLILILFFHNFLGMAQLDEYKDKIYNMKLNRSPAKELIIQTDKDMESFKTQGSLGHLISSGRTDAVKKFYEKIENNKAEILKLDPKWKTDRIDGFLAEKKEYYDRICKHLQEEEELLKQMSELEQFFTYKKKQYNDARGDGKFFYDYVTGNDTASFNWHEIENKLAEIDGLEKKYKELELDKRPLRDPDFEIKNFGFFTDYNKGFDTHKSFAESYPSYIEDAYYLSRLNQLEGKQLVERYAVLKDANWTLKAYQHLFPDNENLKKCSSEVLAGISKLEESINKIAVSEFHKDHFNQILFSNKRINFGSETAADFKTNFKGNEPIYITLYLTYAPNSTYNTDALLLYLDNKLVANSSVRPKGEFDYKGEHSAVIHFPLIPAPNDDEVQAVETMMAYNFVNAISKNNGNYSFVFQPISTKSSFDFTIDMDPSFVEAELAKLSVAKKQYIGNPKAKMTDFSVADLVKRALASEERNDKVVDVVILSDEWKYEVHSITNHVLSRELDEIVIQCKDEKGQCYLLVGSLFQSKADGQYQKPIFNLSRYFGEGEKLSVFEDGDYKFYNNCK